MLYSQKWSESSCRTEKKLNYFLHFVYKLSKVCVSWYSSLNIWKFLFVFTLCACKYLPQSVETSAKLKCNGIHVFFGALIKPISFVCLTAVDKLGEKIIQTNRSTEITSKSNRWMGYWWMLGCWVRVRLKLLNQTNKSN